MPRQAVLLFKIIMTNNSSNNSSSIFIISTLYRHEHQPIIMLIHLGVSGHCAHAIHLFFFVFFFHWIYITMFHFIHRFSGSVYLFKLFTFISTFMILFVWTHLGLKDIWYCFTVSQNVNLCTYFWIYKL